MQLYAGLTSDSLRGYMDELKFYDHGLTPGELELLNKGTAANDAPSATISTLPLWALVWRLRMRVRRYVCVCSGVCVALNLGSICSCGGDREWH